MLSFSALEGWFKGEFIHILMYYTTNVCNEQMDSECKLS